MLTLHHFTLLTLVATTLTACGTDPVDSETSATTNLSSTADPTLTSTTDGATTPTSTTGEPTTDGTTGPTTDAPTTDAPTTDAPTTDVSTTDASTTDVSGSTTDEPSALCPEHAAADACCCFEAHVNAAATIENVCGTEKLCPDAVFDCIEIDGTCTTKDQAAVDCVLGALGDGTTAGSVSIQYIIDNYYGQHRIDLYLQGDGTAYVADKQEMDVTGYLAPTGHYTLQAPDYFMTCLASDDVEAKAACLETVITGEASEVCTEEAYYET